ncbi:MAG: hypothetical protein JXL84_14985 [Deltaproteobacteria bacterium]|nr:hypothetical protein [Deltaproteobacteria bacterium]
MTELNVVRRGVETVREGTCIECAAWIDDGNGFFGLCNNGASSHYGHAVAFKHPSCRKVLRMANATQETVKKMGKF